MLRDVGVAEDGGGEARREGSFEVGEAGRRDFELGSALAGGLFVGAGEEGEVTNGCPNQVLGVLEDLRADRTTIDGACTVRGLDEGVGAPLDEEQG